METIFGIILAVSIATERFMEILKPLFLRTKNAILKKEYDECMKAEKIVLSIGVGVLICVVGGISIDIPGLVGILPAIVTGLIASLGSNAIHTILSLVTAFKDVTEEAKNG